MEEAFSSAVRRFGLGLLALTIGWLLLLVQIVLCACLVRRVRHLAPLDVRMLPSLSHPLRTKLNREILVPRTIREPTFIKRFADIS